MRFFRTGRVAVASATRIAAVLLAAAPVARAQESPEGAEGANPPLDDSATKPPAADPAEGARSEARRALERATRLRSAGDEARAKAVDSLAKEWAETARDITRAVAEEAKAAALRRKAVDTQARVERARALVEEEIGHVGRLRAQLEEASRAAGVSVKRRSLTGAALEVHDPAPQATPHTGNPAGAPAATRPSADDRPPKNPNAGAVAP